MIIIYFFYIYTRYKDIGKNTNVDGRNCRLSLKKEYLGALIMSRLHYFIMTKLLSTISRFSSRFVFFAAILLVFYYLL